MRIMAGENLSSTDLHLACNDTLLVGQVAEMMPIDPNDPMAANRLHNRKLQVRRPTGATLCSSPVLVHYIFTEHNIFKEKYFKW